MGEEIVALQRQLPVIVCGRTIGDKPLARNLELHGPLPEDFSRHELHDTRCHRSRLPRHFEGAVAREIHFIRALAKQITHQVIHCVSVHCEEGVHLRVQHLLHHALVCREAPFNSVIHLIHIFPFIHVCAIVKARRLGRYGAVLR